MRNRSVILLAIGFILIVIGIGLTLHGTTLPEDLTISPSRIDPSRKDTTNIFIASGLITLFVGVFFVMYWIFKRVELPTRKTA